MRTTVKAPDLPFRMAELPMLGQSTLSETARTGLTNEEIVEIADANAREAGSVTGEIFFGNAVKQTILAHAGGARGSRQNLIGPVLCQPIPAVSDRVGLSEHRHFSHCETGDPELT